MKNKDHTEASSIYGKSATDEVSEPCGEENMTFDKLYMILGSKCLYYSVPEDQFAQRYVEIRHMNEDDIDD